MSTSASRAPATPWSASRATTQPTVELDLGNASSGEEGSLTTFDGATGVQVDNIFSKLMFAVRFGEPNFLLSDLVHDNSQVLYNREPRERVERAAPWLTVDSDPYPAVIDGRIVWILDGYTTTDRYPLAERESVDTMLDDSLTPETTFGTLPTDEINYMRNAVKATVDAYDGTVNLYAWDESDPMLEAWRNAFPGTVQDRDEIPDSVMEHLRYPEDLFKVQRYQFARYHVTDAGDFYQDNDRWEVPEDPYVDGTYQPPYRLFVDDPSTVGDEHLVAHLGLRAAQQGQPRVVRLGELRRDQRRLRPDHARCSSPTSRSTDRAWSPTRWPTATTSDASCRRSTSVRPSRPSATC